MADERFIKGSGDDAKALFEIIKRRIEWMDENSIDQWNNHDYLNVFPLGYYLKKADEGALYVYKKGGKTVCGAVIGDSDRRWDDGEAALYIHNFASDIGYPGAGRKLLLFLIETAKSRGCRWVRLDCDESNKRLNEYYDAFGFVTLDGFTEGPYRGVKKQKAL